MTDRRGLVDIRRALLRVAGADARAFLQGLVTNDVARLELGRAVYAALLTAQGKYLFDFVMVDAGDGSVLLDVAADRAAALLQRLSLYRLRRAVSVTAEGGMGVVVVWGAEPMPGAAALVVPDPRCAALGWRLYAEDPLAALAEAGALPATVADYDALRLAHAVPDSGTDLVPEDTYILEAGFERLGGVDFRKGCYVGQEVVARMHHKTTLRKGLMPVRVEGAAPPPGTPVLMPDGRAAGTLHSVQSGIGLAHLRFDRLDGPLTAGEARVIPQPG